MSIYLSSKYFWAFVMQKHAFVFQYWDDIVSNKNEFQHNKFQGLLNSLAIRIWVGIWQLASPSFSLQIFPATAKTTTFHCVPISANVKTSAGALFLAAFSHAVTSKVEKILKGSLDSIPSPSPSVKIQIMGGKVCLRCSNVWSFYLK